MGFSATGLWVGCEKWGVGRELRMGLEKEKQAGHAAEPLIIYMDK